MSQRRITIVNNSNPDQAKILIIPLNLAIQQFLLLATQKLAFKAKRLYLADGQEIDDVEYLHDGDVIYVSGGEPFFKASASQWRTQHCSWDARDGECWRVLTVVACTCV